MPHGVIVKGIGGFYYVRTEDGIAECRARGRFRRENTTPLVGDEVDITGDGGLITDIGRRRNQLARPPVANVDQVIIVFAPSMPEINMDLLERMVLQAEHNRLRPVICINKMDLRDGIDIDGMLLPYRRAGYSVIYTSMNDDRCMSSLRDVLEGSISVFSGSSGVGKSTLLNRLNPSFNLKTGDISSKAERGRNTTRQVELLQLDNGAYVVDTPGFSSLDLDFIDKDEIEGLFPEFRDYLGRCRFVGCRHIDEPDCAIKEAVEKDLISRARYDSYVRFYNTSALRRRYR